MGSEWGLRPLRIGSTTRRLGDPLCRRGQAPKARQSRHPGSRLGLTSGDPRQHLGDRPRREPDGRTDGPRTRAPHGEERSEKTGGRRIGQTASDRDRGTR